MQNEMSKKAEAWFVKHVKHQACPACDGTEMTIDTELWLTPHAAKTAASVSADLAMNMVLVAIWCNACAHVRHFHAKNMGLA